MKLLEMYDRDQELKNIRRQWTAIRLPQLRHISESHCASQQFETYSLASLLRPRGSSVLLLPAV